MSHSLLSVWLCFIAAVSAQSPNSPSSTHSGLDNLWGWNKENVADTPYVPPGPYKGGSNFTKRRLTSKQKPVYKPSAAKIPLAVKEKEKYKNDDKLQSGVDELWALLGFDGDKEKSTVGKYFEEMYELPVPMEIFVSEEENAFSSLESIEEDSISGSSVLAEGDDESLGDSSFLYSEESDEEDLPVDLNEKYFEEKSTIFDDAIVDEEKSTVFDDIMEDEEKSLDRKLAIFDDVIADDYKEKEKSLEGKLAIFDDAIVAKELPEDQEFSEDEFPIKITFNCDLNRKLVSVVASIAGPEPFIFKGTLSIKDEILRNSLQNMTLFLRKDSLNDILPFLSADSKRLDFIEKLLILPKSCAKDVCVINEISIFKEESSPNLADSIYDDQKKLVAKRITEEEPEGESTVEEKSDDGLIKEEPDKIVKDLSPDTTNELSPDTVKELSSDTVNELSSDIVKELSSDIVNELSSDIVNELSSDIVKELSTDIVKELSNSVKELSDDKIELLNDKTINELSCISSEDSLANDKNIVEAEHSTIEDASDFVARMEDGNFMDLFNSSDRIYKDYGLFVLAIKSPKFDAQSFTQYSRLTEQFADTFASLLMELTLNSEMKDFLFSQSDRMDISEKIPEILDTPCNEKYLSLCSKIPRLDMISNDKISLLPPGCLELVPDSAFRSFRSVDAVPASQFSHFDEGKIESLPTTAISKINSTQIKSLIESNHEICPVLSRHQHQLNACTLKEFKMQCSSAFKSSNNSLILAFLIILVIFYQ